jgi:hypothetical protein
MISAIEVTDSQLVTQELRERQNSMCTMVYIGSDFPLPITEPFDRNSRKFHTSQDIEIPEGVKETLGLHYIVYAGSKDGCGCGFRFKKGRKMNPEYRKSLECLNALRLYLEKASHNGKVRLLAIWAGEENKEVRTKMIVHPNYFSGHRFFLKEYVLLDIQNR